MSKQTKEENIRISLRKEKPGINESNSLYEDTDSSDLNGTLDMTNDGDFLQALEKFYKYPTSTI